MFRHGEKMPEKGDRIIITVEDVIIEGTIDVFKERGAWGSQKRLDEPEPINGWWFDVGISIESKGD